MRIEGCRDPWKGEEACLYGAKWLGKELLCVELLHSQPRPLVMLFQDLQHAGVRQDAPVHQQQRLAVKVHETLRHVQIFV